jgi:hypothetical protein
VQKEILRKNLLQAWPFNQKTIYWSYEN